MESYKTIFLIPLSTLLLFHCFTITLSQEISPSAAPIASPSGSPIPRPEISEEAIPINNELPEDMEQELETETRTQTQSMDVSTPPKETSDMEEEPEAETEAEGLRRGNLFGQSLQSVNPVGHVTGHVAGHVKGHVNNLIGGVARTVSPFLNNLCRKTDYPDLCVSSVSPLIRGRVDVYGILGKAIESTMVLAKAGYQLAQRLAATPGTSRDLKNILNNCKESYDDVMYNFQEAITALQTKDIGRLNSVLSAAITDVGDCTDEFSGQPSPLATYDDKVTKMTSNCLAIVAVVPEFHK